MQAVLESGVLHRDRLPMKNHDTAVYIHISKHLLCRSRLPIFTYTRCTRSYKTLLHCSIQRRPLYTKNWHLQAMHVQAPIVYYQSAVHQQGQYQEGICLLLWLPWRILWRNPRNPKLFPLRVVCRLSGAKRFWVPVSHERIEHSKTVPLRLFVDPRTRGSPM